LAAQRGLTAFAGRDAELAQMRRAFELARSGHGQLLAVVGEAGTGKSRLFHEFKASLPAECKLLEAYSVSHGKASAWLPVLELLRGYFVIQVTDDPTTRREKIRAVLAALDPALDDTLPYLFGLLGIQESPDPLVQMNPQVRRRRTLEAIKRVILRESLQHPLVMIFEDLHWIDAETQALLDLLADAGAGARLLLLVNYRPEYRHEWSARGHYLQLRLDPLGGENAAAMMAALLGEAAEVEALKRVIAERAGGNPFFIEEMVQALLDQGVLVRNGTVKVVRSLSQLRLPPTVQGVLASRIDRLPAEQKELLQNLAVMGRKSPLGLIRKVFDRAEAQLERMLADLRAAEFIYEQPALTDAEYIFKHALTQEVAYNSVLMERRKQLHERVGAALESIYAESLDDHVAELAHQYARGCNPDKAVEYCQRAMWRFQYLGSIAEALAQFESGLELLQKLPDDNHRAELELDLRNSALGTVGDSKGVASPEVEQSYVRAMELSQRPGINWEKAWWALYGVLFVHLTRPDLRKASEIAGELVARAEEHGSAELVADAETYLACARMYSGDFELAAQGFERGWSLLESIVKPATDLTQWRRARTISRLLGSRQNNRALSAWNLWFLGYPDRALERMSTANTIAHSRSKSMLADIHGYAAYLCELRREAEPMKVWAGARLVLATESGYPVGRALSEIYLGWADALAGDLDGGIVRMRHHLSELRATGFAAGASYHLALIATAVAKMARFDEGLRTIDESFRIIERTGQRQHEAEVHRLRGELLLAQDSSNAAHSEKSFRTAIEIARKQRAKSWELRATTSLARLLAKQGRRDEARAMLAEIYGWFIEGFDTADLKDAKALLDELE
jgi:tetratricopeptide (TPR) repeat protein